MLRRRRGWKKTERRRTRMVFQLVENNCRSKAFPNFSTAEETGDKNRIKYQLS